MDLVSDAVFCDTGLQIIFLKFLLIEFKTIVVFVDSMTKAGFTILVLVTVNVKKPGNKRERN